MKRYIEGYMKLIRGGFFKESYKFLAVTILVLIAFALKIGADVEVIIFTFLGMGIFLDLDERKYSLATALPMKIKTRIKMLYINTYVICFLGSLSAQLAYLIRGELRPISTMVIVWMLSVIGCNLYYLIFASNEFKEDPQEQIAVMIAYTLILTMAGMILLIIHFAIKGSIISYLIEHSSILFQIMSIGVLVFLTGVMTAISYKSVVKKAYTGIDTSY